MFLYYVYMCLDSLSIAFLLLCREWLWLCLHVLLLLLCVYKSILLCKLTMHTGVCILLGFNSTLELLLFDVSLKLFEQVRISFK